MARLPYVDPEAMPPAVRSVYDRFPVKLNIFRMAAHAETCFRNLIALGGDILARQQLSPQLRELAILQVASASRASYEWAQHVDIGRAVGVSEAQIEALERGDGEAVCFDEDERWVLRFTREMLRDVRVGDETFTRTAARFSPREIVELTLTVGYYMMIARLLETTGVDAEGLRIGIPADSGTRKPRRAPGR